MPIDQFLIVIAVFGAALVLIAVGMIIRMRNRSAAGNSHAAAISSKPAPEWIKNLAGAAGKTLTGETPLSTTQLDGIIVTRDPASSEWDVEVNGTRYRNLKDIHDDLTARKVLEALSGLQRFAGSIPIVNAPAPTADSSPTAPRSSAGPALAATSATKFPVPKDSLLDQIETILQRNLARHPALAARTIHIGAAPDGTLLIEVDRQIYQSPEDVPEAEVRDIIRSSIHEWERS